MIPYKELLMVRLQWPTPPADTALARKHKAVLTAARRCLIDSAPAAFHGTGFQLLRRSEEPELRACLEGILDEVSIKVSEVLVVLPAPEECDYTRALYAESFKGLKADLAQALRQVAARIPSGKLTCRLFNSVYDKLDILSKHVQNDQIYRVRRLLDQLSEFQHHEDRVKGARLTSNLAKLVDQLD